MPHPTDGKRFNYLGEGLADPVTLEVWDRYDRGESAGRIARSMGLNVREANDRIVAGRALIPTPATEEARLRISEDLDELRARLFELADMEGAPVTSGKDGAVVYDPETAQPVRDYTLRVKAMETLLKAYERKAKLWGLDAPAKLDHTIRGEQEAAEALAQAARERLRGQQAQGL